ncbi:hypothetical protein [Streptomyces sp. NPDC021224]|uniref:hypothetical protein n=1 Tax=unclassified Streptomyces TaxID=2593676 RepID=UPI0037B05F81
MINAELADSSVSVTAAHPGLMRTGSHLAAEFGGQADREFGWFSAVTGSPPVPTDAGRAADRIVSALDGAEPGSSSPPPRRPPASATARPRPSR